MCTHAIYAFIGLNSDGTIQILDRWGDIDNRKFVTKDPTLRSKFVTNLYNFVKQYGFSGLDLDWEYPARRGGAPEDKVNFVSLVRELSAKFKPEGLLLTAAVSASVSEMSISYDVPALSPHLDLIHLMTYDFHGPWEHHTGIHSALYASSVDQDPNLNAICYLKYPGGYSPNWAAQQKVPFTFRGDQWVGYENIESIKYKLAGMLVWSIDTDDKHNYCGKGSMPLLNTMKRELGN
ncbi:hypothetical protein B566_EDAN009600 [Ephemera danica]|nr:hypothetical protein B566_EDAN009600 [Ephemera danica]